MDWMEKGEGSAYKDWFYPKQYPIRLSASCYECVGDYPYMPRLNGANPEVRKYVRDVLLYWLDRAHIDGWRFKGHGQAKPPFFPEAELNERLNSMLMRYPDDANLAMYNCLGSHDTARFLTEAKGEKWRLRLAMASSIAARIFLKVRMVLPPHDGFMIFTE